MLHSQDYLEKFLEILESGNLRNEKSINDSNFEEIIYKAYYGFIDINEYNLDLGVNRGAGYVPFKYGSTQLIIFNFLRINYSIKDPAFFRISIIFEGKLVYQKNFIVAANSILSLDNKYFDKIDDLTNNKSLGIAVVEVYHPKLKLQNNLFRFLALYNNGIELAGIHSISISNQISRKYLGNRALGFVNEGYYYVSTNDIIYSYIYNNEDDLNLMSGDIEIGIPGFIVKTNKNSDISSVWHDCDKHFSMLTPTVFNKRYGNIRQGFTLPDVESEVFIVIRKEQIGFLPKKIKLDLYSKKNNIRESLIFDINKNNSYIHLTKKYFSKKHSGPVSIIADFGKDHGEFKGNATNYLFLYYKSPDGFTDHVHSQISSGFYMENEKIFSSFRCRKFGLLIKKKGFESQYSIINDGGLYPNKDNRVKIRIFTDKDNEFVFSKKLKKKIVNIITSDEIFKFIGKNSISKVGIVQIENDFTNYNGNWIIYNKINGKIAVDHLTGG